MKIHLLGGKAKSAAVRHIRKGRDCGGREGGKDMRGKAEGG